jgi:Cu/Ag efflux protein CusF
MKIGTPSITLLMSMALIGVAPLAARAEQDPNTAAGVMTAPGKIKAVATTQRTATVVAIDAGSREVTLKDADGKVFNVNAGDQVRNFDQIKVGDKVKAEYTEALSLKLKKRSSGTPQASEQDTVDRAPQGAKPGAVVGRTVTALADVVAVNAKQQTVTLRGPLGNSYDLNVRDPAQLKNIKQGDQVEVVYTEALAISVEAAT